MSSPDYNDEIERMMGGAGANPGVGAPPPPADEPPGNQVPNPALGEHGYPTPGGIPRPPREDPEIIAMRDQLNAAQAQIRELQQRTPLPTSTGEVYQSPPVPPQQNVEQIKRQLEESFLKDPGGTLLSVAAYMQQQTEKMIDERVNKSTGGIRSDVTSGNVQAFRQKMLADPILAPAVDEFDKLVKDTGDKLQPGNMNQQLEGLASMALGNTFRHRLPGSRQQMPPAWGGGLPAGSPDTGQGAPSGGAKLSVEQEEYVKAMIDLGLDKSVIAERLKNWDYEGGFTKQ